jgi:hypothetical protein
MNAARSFPAFFLAGFLALSGIQASFGQATPAPGSQPQPAAGDQPLPAPALQADPPAAAQPLPAAPAQPLPTAPVQPFPPAPVQPLPAAPVQPVAPAEQPFPGVGVPSLSLIRGSHIIGSTAILPGGVVIGTVQDLLSVAGSGEYVLVANPNGFVAIPRSLTIFDPVSRILHVNMTFAQCGELPRLLQLAQLNRQFLERVHGFFRSPRGEAILRNGIVRNTSPAHGPNVAERRPETRTASKRAIHPQTRTEHPENGNSVRR